MDVNVLYGTFDANKEPLFFILILSAPNSAVKPIIATRDFSYLLQHNLIIMILGCWQSLFSWPTQCTSFFYTPPTTRSTVIETRDIARRSSLITVKTWASWICIWRRLVVIWDIGFCEWTFNEMIMERGRKRRVNGLNIAQHEQWTTQQWKVKKSASRTIALKHISENALLFNVFRS